jgi:Bacterial Ig-like domain (group 3)
MRRLIPSSLLFLAALLCAAALFSPAGAVGASSTLCPEGSQTCCPLPTKGPPSGASQTKGSANTADRSNFVPCCPTPTNGTCCTSGSTCCTTACCTTTCCTTTCCTPTCTSGGLTIAASPDPSTAGRKVVISGGLTSNPPATGATVVLWRKLSGQSTFHQLTTTTTDSAGQYKFTMKRGSVNADQQWYVTANGLQSPTLTQDVNALVGLTPSSRSVAAGSPVVLKGRVTPSHAGQVVLIEQSRGGSWAVIGRPRLAHSSTYTMSHRFTQAGTVKLRAVLQGDARNNRSNSPTVTVTVK